MKVFEIEKRLRAWVHGWVRRVWRVLSKTQLNLLANSLSFTTLLSLVPFMAVVFAMVDFFDYFEFLVPKIEGLMLDHFRDAIGPGLFLWLKKSIGRLQSGHVGFLGAIFLLFGSLQILRDLDMGIQLIFSQRHRDAAWRRYLTYWAALFLLPIIAAVFVSLQTLPLLGEAVGFTGDGWLFVFLVLLALNKFMPPVQVRWKVALVSGTISLLLLLTLQHSFGFLVKSVFNYSRIYGSFATLPALMIYLQGVWYTLLAGLVVNASLTKPTDRIPQTPPKA